MRIKPIRSQVDPAVVSAPVAPLDVSTGFAQGLGQIGQAIGEAGQAIQTVERRKKAFDDSTSLTELTSEAKVLFAEHSELIKMSDYNDIPTAKKEGLERIKATMSDRASKVNQEVVANWQKVWSVLNAESIIETGRIETEKFRQNTIAGVVNYTNIIEDEAVKAIIEGDEEKRDIIFEAVNNAINNVQANFRVPGHQAEAWKEQFKNNVETHIRAVEKESERQKEKGVITNAYIGISQQARDPITKKVDYALAYKLLRTPQTLKDYGITAEQKKELTLILQNDEARQRETDDVVKEQQRGEILTGIISGEITFDMIEDSELSANEKYNLKTTIEKRNKAIVAGEKDPYQEYDPGKRAEISRLIRTDPEEITDKGGIEWIYEHVGLGKKGGLTIEQAERFANDYKKRNSPGKGPTAQQTYKEAVGSLDLFRKNWFFIEAEPGDDVSNKEQSENEQIYGQLVEELEDRVNAGEKPYEVLEDIAKPYATANAEGMFSRFFSWAGGLYSDEAIEEEPGSKREQAIKLLRENRKLVNEETIKTVMDQL